MLLRYMSLEVKGLPPSTYGLSSPGTSSQLKSSSAGAIWMCKDFFTGSSCPLPCIWFRSLPNRQWLGWWFSHTCSICWIWSAVRSSIWSPICITGHSSRNRMHGDVVAWWECILDAWKYSYVPSLEIGEKLKEHHDNCDKGKSTIVKHRYMGESPHHALGEDISALVHYLFQTDVHSHQINHHFWNKNSQLGECGKLWGSPSSICTHYTSSQHYFYANHAVIHSFG